MNAKSGEGMESISLAGTDEAALDAPLQMTRFGRLLCTAAVLLVLGFGVFVIMHRLGLGIPFPGRPTSANPVPGVAGSNAAASMVASLQAQVAQDKIRQSAQTSAFAQIDRERRASEEQLEQALEMYDGRLAVLQHTLLQSPATVQGAAPVKNAVAAVVAAASDAHAAAASVKAHSVDISVLPIEIVTAASIGVTGFTQDGVEIGDRILKVGQDFRSGEKIVGIDPGGRSIVTSLRIINVTN